MTLKKKKKKRGEKERGRRKKKIGSRGCVWIGREGLRVNNAAGLNFEESWESVQLV